MYALHKLAWCDFNAQEYDQALSKFKQVVTTSEQAENRARAAAAQGGGTQDAIRLKREALNDMVLTYSQLGVVKEAYIYLGKKAGKERAYHLTDKLSQIYHNQGKYQKQIEALRLLLKIDPDYTQAPDFQSKIVAAYSKLTDRDAVRREVEILVNNYGRVGVVPQTPSGQRFGRSRHYAGRESNAGVGDRLPPLRAKI